MSKCVKLAPVSSQAWATIEEIRKTKPTGNINKLYKKEKPMKISDLQKELNKIKKQHGNLDVCLFGGAESSWESINLVIDKVRTMNADTEKLSKTAHKKILQVVSEYYFDEVVGNQA